MHKRSIALTVVILLGLGALGGSVFAENPSLPTDQGLVPAAVPTYRFTEAKPQAVTEHVSGPVPETTGGPDAFGYRFIDSKSQGGPGFCWLDISATGTQVFGPGVDDEYAYPVPLGFTFNFYGDSFTQVAIGSNGHIYFMDQYLGLGNECIPGTNSYGPEEFIALYWNDLYMADGRVLYQTMGTAPNRRFVVMFNNVSFCCSTPTSPMNFEAILSEADGSIALLYLNPSAFGGSWGQDNGGYATIGIQKDPTLGLQYSCNTASLSANLAIAFYTKTFTGACGSAFTQSFYDDAGVSQFCVDTSTGAWKWNILKGTKAGQSYSGTGIVQKSASGFMIYSKPAQTYWALKLQYLSASHSALGYFRYPLKGVVSNLMDSNTLNDPPCY